MFIFPTLLDDFKDPIQNRDLVSALWAELHIAHVPHLFFYFNPITKIIFFSRYLLTPYMVVIWALNGIRAAIANRVREGETTDQTVNKLRTKKIGKSEFVEW